MSQATIAKFKVTCSCGKQGYALTWKDKPVQVSKNEVCFNTVIKYIDGWTYNEATGGVTCSECNI